MTKNDLIENLVHVPVFTMLCWAWYRKFVSSKPVPKLIDFSVRFVKLLLAIATFGLLIGCSNPDPLAVASGPLFPLNPGHWLPTPQDPSAPPVVMDK